MLHDRAKQKGFSIIEFCIVLTVLAIIAILLAPSFSTHYAQNRVKSVAEGLYDDIMYARTRAVETSTNVTLVFTTGSNWCYGMTTATNCTCSTANSCNLGQTTNTGYPNTSVTNTLTTNATTFDSVRGVPNVTGTVTISSTQGPEQIVLTLNPFGTATLCSSNTVGGYSC